LGGGEIAAEEAAARLLHLINIARMLRSLKMAWTRKAYQIIIEYPKKMSTRDARVQILKILKNRRAVNLK